MEITLKNIKIAKFMSQETICYQATIYVDGKKAGTVENEGHGGCSNVYLNPVFGYLHSQKFTQPCGCLEIPDMGDKCVICKGTGKWEVGIDSYCDQLVYDNQREKQQKTFINKLRKGGYNYMVITKSRYHGFKAPSELHIRQTMKKSYPNEEIISITAI